MIKEDLKNVVDIGDCVSPYTILQYGNGGNIFGTLKPNPSKHEKYYLVVDYM